MNEMKVVLVAWVCCGFVVVFGGVVMPLMLRMLRGVIGWLLHCLVFVPWMLRESLVGNCIVWVLVLFRVPRMLQWVCHCIGWLLNWLGIAMVLSLSWFGCIGCLIGW